MLIEEHKQVFTSPSSNQLMVLTKQCLKGKSQKGGKDETDLFGAFVSLDPSNNLNALSNDKGCPGQGHNKIPVHITKCLLHTKYKQNTVQTVLNKVLMLKGT